MNYGEKIIALRKKKGITQAELGAELNVTYQAVSKWERGESQPDFGTMSKIAHFFDVPLSYFESETEIVETVEEVATTTETIEEKAEEKRLLGVCHDCGKALYEGDAAKVSPYLLCATCNQNHIREENLKKQEEERQKKQEEYRIAQENEEIKRYRNKGLIWSAVITAILLIGGIVTSVQLPTETEVWTSIGYTALGGVFVFFWIPQMIWDGAVRACAAGGTSIFGEIGVIFELDLDGIIFLIAVKLFWWLLKAVIFLATSLICVLASIMIAPFTFIPALIRINRGDIY